MNDYQAWLSTNPGQASLAAINVKAFNEPLLKECFDAGRASVMVNEELLEVCKGALAAFLQSSAASVTFAEEVAALDSAIASATKHNLPRSPAPVP